VLSRRCSFSYASRYDAGKKINGGKRHIVTDTVGQLVAAPVHPADIQDRDRAPDLLAAIRYLFPWLRHVFGDGGYAGDKLTTALARHDKWRIEIVKRSDQAAGFRVLPRRWVVERTFAWLNHNRRLAKDFERPSAAAGRGSISRRSNCWHAASHDPLLITTP
jgi:putative transposase